jgi:hypothetical protein
LRPLIRTSFNHQPEAQHPKSSAIHKLPGRLPHLLATDGRLSDRGARGSFASKLPITRR